MVLRTSTNGTSAITAPHRSGSELTIAPISSPPAERPAVAMRPALVHPCSISPLATSTKSLNVLPFGAIAGGVIACGNLLNLQDGKAAGGDVIVIDRAWRDHRFIAQPQRRDVIFGIVAQARGIARLREGDRLGHGRRVVAVDGDLIEAVAAPFDDEEVPIAFDSGHVEMRVRRDQLVPVAGRVEAGSTQPPHRIGIVGVDEERAVVRVDVIFAAFLAGRDQDRRGEGIVGGQQPHFAGDVIAGADDDPLAIARLGDGDAIAFVILVEQLDVVFDGRAEPVEARIVGAPLVVGDAVEEARIVGGPDDLGQHAGDDLGQMLAGGKVLHAHLEPLGAAVVDRIGEQPPVVADRKGAEAEIFLALGEGRLVEQQFVRPARDGLAPPFAILAAGLERGPVEPVAILLRDRGFVLLDARLHLFVQRVDQRLVRRHDGFEIGVLGFEIGEDVGVGDLGILRVLQPGIGVVDRHAMRGETVGAALGDGGRGVGHRLAVEQDGGVITPPTTAHFPSSRP
ncbi:hypothetical protein WR25_09833 [Diploscapter pachys]|uniref:Uncharacterized protein n=1 Tax=Diploscapter pachys TaxID=2018661 RepID=A0A2A2K8P5_9BILA|nr:hypothetical protein WR25_09833 [Diploscapter pachys]